MITYGAGKATDITYDLSQIASKGGLSYDSSTKTLTIPKSLASVKAVTGYLIYVTAKTSAGVVITNNA